MKKKTDVQRSIRFRLTPLAAAIFAVTYPAAVVLAEEGAERAKGIEEIIVTATKREADLQDVAQSIGVLTGADLEQKGIKSIAEYIRAMPSIAMQATVPGRNQIVMRGISSGSNEYRTDSQVALYLDEQPMTTNSQQVGVRAIDMQRIETLPGPQGTLFGSASQTGTMRYITNKPDHNGISGSIDLGVGATKGGDESFDVSGHLNIPLIEDVLAIRAVAYSSKDGGYVDNVLGSSLSGNFDNADEVDKNFNKYKTLGGRVAALWTINDEWSTLFSLVGEKNSSDGTWESDPALGDFKVTRFVDEFRDDDWYSAAITLTGDLGFAELSLTGTHFEREIAYEWDNNTYSQQKDRVSGGPAYLELFYSTLNTCYYIGGGDYYACAYAAADANAAAGYVNYGLYDTEYIRNSIVNDQSQNRETIELRLTSQGDSRLKWMVGGYWEDVYDEWFYFTHQPELTSTRAWTAAQTYAYYFQGMEGIQYPLPDTDIGYSNDFERTVEQIAVFGELGYDLTDKLSVTAGVRWSEFKRDDLDIFQFPQGLGGFLGPNATGGEFGGKGKDRDTIFKVGAQYNIDDDRMVYALFSQGFRLGGVNNARAVATGNVPATFGPDFLDNYEVGIKSQWLDNTLQINASAFLMKWRDWQTSVFGIGAWWIRGTVNAEGAQSKGVEVDVQWQATDRLKFTGNVFLADPEFTDDFFDPNDPTSLEIRKGMTMPGSPKSKGQISVSYDVPNVMGGDLWFYYDFSFRAKSWNTTGNILNNNRNGLAKGWTWSNFATGIVFQNDVSVTLRVDNVFDQKTTNYITTFDNDDADRFGDVRFHNVRSIDRPRTIWLSARKSF